MLETLMAKATAPLTKFVGVLLALVAFACIVVSLKLYVDKLKAERKDAIASEKLALTKLDSVIQTNLQNAQAFNDLVDIRRQDSEVLLHLSARITNIQVSLEKTKQSISQLEQTNAEVKKYLDTPVPDDLRRLLNGPRNQGGDADAGGKGDSAVVPSENPNGTPDS